MMGQFGMTDSGSSKGEIRKDDFISKFQVNELVPLLKIAEKYKIEITEGKRYLVRALHIARTTRNFEEIITNLKKCRAGLVAAIENHLNQWLSFVKLDADAKKTMLPKDSPLPHLVQTASIFILEGNYETAADVLCKAEIELLKITSPQSTAECHPPASVTDTSASQTEDKIKTLPEKPGAPATPERNASVDSKPDISIDRENVLNQPQANTPPAKKKSGYSITKIEEMVKCGACMGKIKEGSIAIECDCGIYYHESCAKRIHKCQNCDTEFE